jgi:hypothetical protein
MCVRILEKSKTFEKIGSKKLMTGIDIKMTEIFTKTN